MITYDQFKKEYNLNELKSINLISSLEENNQFEFIADVSILDTPENYEKLSQEKNNLDIIYLSPAGSKEYYSACRKLIENCNDNIKISHNLISSSSKQDFLKSEEIIQNLIDEINPEWDTKHILAFVHYKLGFLLSYYPDFQFAHININLQEARDTRDIWKSLSTGSSVCNGIAEIEQNILSRLNIKTQILSSGTHAFILAETEDGNILLDTTWDLENTLFQARPMFFGKTYEQLREIDGICKSHYLENPPKDVIEISESELREIYHDLGITNEDRTFKLPIYTDVDKVIAENPEFSIDRIDKFLDIFTTNYSTEASHLSESRTMLESCIYDFEIEPSNLTTKFVYSKNDKHCQKAFLAIHINNEDAQQQMRILDLSEMKFRTLDLKEFDELFSHHYLDTTTPFWKQYMTRTQPIITQENEISK